MPPMQSTSKTVTAVKGGSSPNCAGALSTHSNGTAYPKALAAHGAGPSLSTLLVYTLPTIFLLLLFLSLLLLLLLSFVGYYPLLLLLLLTNGFRGAN